MNITDLFGSHSLALRNCVSLLVVELFNSLFSVKDIPSRTCSKFLKQYWWNLELNFECCNGILQFTCQFFPQLMTRMFSTPAFNGKNREKHWKQGKMRKGEGQKQLSNIHYLAIVTYRKCEKKFHKNRKDRHKIDGSEYCRHCKHCFKKKNNHRSTANTIKPNLFMLYVVCIIVGKVEKLAHLWLEDIHQKPAQVKTEIFLAF